MYNQWLLYLSESSVELYNAQGRHHGESDAGHVIEYFADYRFVGVMPTK